MFFRYFAAIYILFFKLLLGCLAISPLCQFDILLQGSELLNSASSYDFRFSLNNDIADLIASVSRPPHSITQIENRLLSIARYRYDSAFIQDIIRIIRDVELKKNNKHAPAFRLLLRRLETQLDELMKLHIILRNIGHDISQNLIAYVHKCSGALSELIKYMKPVTGAGCEGVFETFIALMDDLDAQITEPRILNVAESVPEGDLGRYYLDLYAKYGFLFKLSDQQQAAADVVFLARISRHYEILKILIRNGLCTRAIQKCGYLSLIAKTGIELNIEALLAWKNDFNQLSDPHARLARLVLDKASRLMFFEKQRDAHVFHAGYLETVHALLEKLLVDITAAQCSDSYIREPGLEEYKKHELRLSDVAGLRARVSAAIVLRSRVISLLGDPRWQAASIFTQVCDCTKELEGINFAGTHHDSLDIAFAHLDSHNAYEYSTLLADVADRDRSHQHMRHVAIRLYYGFAYLRNVPCGNMSAFAAHVARSLPLMKHVASKMAAGALEK